MERTCGQASGARVAGVQRVKVEEGCHASLEGDHARATSLLEQSIPRAREVGDPWLIAQSLHHSAVNAFQCQDMEQATTFAEGALAVAREAGSSRRIETTMLRNGPSRPP